MKQKTMALSSDTWNTAHYLMKMLPLTCLGRYLISLYGKILNIKVTSVLFYFSVSTQAKHHPFNSCAIYVLLALTSLT